MTGYTVHTGSTVKFSNSWDRIFTSKSVPAKPAAAKKRVTKKGKSKRRA